ncbi:metallophosphoesterase [Thermodesulfobacteriota bacterium]
MDKALILMAALAAFLLLSQWYVFISVRKYLFQRYFPISRRVAYAVLGVLGLGNYLFIRLVLDSSLLPPFPLTKNFTAIAFFTYLGLVLMLCLFFPLLPPASAAVHLRRLFKRLLGNRSKEERTAQRCAGETPGDLAVTEACQDREMPSAESSRHLVPSNPKTAETESDAVYANALSDRIGLPDSARRAFLKWGAATSLATAITLSGHGIAQAYGPQVREEFDFTHPLLSGIDRPVTVIHVTDLHFGLFYGLEELEHLVQELNAIEADALFITGDLFHSQLSPVEMASPVLKYLKPRRFGNLVVLGNHDYYAGERRSVESIRKAGLTLLRDDWVTFRDGHSVIHIGGLDDPMTNWLWGKELPNFKPFLEKGPSEEGLRILLSHRPTVMEPAAKGGVDLVFAGHLHGGQLIVPYPGSSRGVSLARLVYDHTHGWYELGDTRMYLNRGVGLTFVPFRINCPPEIGVFHLKPPVAGQSAGAAIGVRKVG